MAKSKASRITMKDINSLMDKHPEIKSNLSFSVKRGKMVLSFLRRAEEIKPDDEEIVVDVDNYTYGELQELIKHYEMYLTFGYTKPIAPEIETPTPEETEETEEVI